MSETPPPLRIREEDGSPNVLPVYNIIVSNGTLTQVDPTTVRLATGAGGGITPPLSTGSGGTGLTSIGSGGTVLGVVTDGSVLEYKVIRSGSSVTVNHSGSSIVISATTNPAVVYAATGNEYLTAALAGDLTAERLVLTTTAILYTDTALSGKFVVGLSSGGAGTYLVSSAGIAGSVAWIATAGAAASVVYAATGNQYVTISAAADLTDEYIIRASTGISLTSASNVLLVHYGSLLVTTSRALNVLFPVSGGGNLSADRTFAVDTAFLLNSGRTINTTLPVSGGGTLSADLTISIVTANNTTTGAIQASDFKDFNLGRVVTSRIITTLYPLTGGGLNLSADRTFSVDTAFLLNTSRTINTTLPLSGGGALSADLTLSIVSANNTTMGAVAAADFKAFNLGRVTTDRTITTLYPLTGGGLNLSADRTFSLDTAFLVNTGRTISTTLPLSGGGTLAADRTFTIVTANNTTTGAIQASDFKDFNLGRALTSLTFGVVSTEASLPNSRQLSGGTGIALTDGGAGGKFFISVSAKTVRLPLALATVQPDSANAFWSAKTGATLDLGYVAYADSGNGTASFYGLIPTNVAPSPLWNVEVYHTSDAGSGGNVVLTLGARTLSAGNLIDSTTTRLVNSAAFLCNTNNTMTISTMSATNFDGTLTVAANQYLHLTLQRNGGDTNDTLSDQWDMYSTILVLDIL